jgi:uncharacterized protein YndB with AHSA1/START domain
MEPLTITRTIDIAAPRERVWAALTTPELLAQWLGQGAVFDATVGAQGSYTWTDWGRFPLVVEAVDAPSTLAVRWASKPDGELSETSSTTVHYTLETIPSGTRLTVMESGFELLDGDRQTAFDNNSHGWDEELAELVSFLERDAA